MNPQPLYIDSKGLLQEQSDSNRSRSLSHTSRMRNEYQNSDTIIQLYTRLDPQARKQYALSKLEQWIKWYISQGYDLPADSAQLHKDAKAIYNSIEIREWWWQLWRERDLNISPKLAAQFSEVVSKMQNKTGPDARFNAQHYCAENYMIFHSYIFATTSDEFKALEYEYAVVIEKVR